MIFLICPELIWDQVRQAGMVFSHPGFTLYVPEPITLDRNPITLDRKNIPYNTYVLHNVITESVECASFKIQTIITVILQFIIFVCLI